MIDQQPTPSVPQPTSAPTPAPAAPVAPTFTLSPQPQSFTTTSPASDPHKGIKFAVSLLVVLLLIGAGYLVWNKGIFGGRVYREDNLLSGMMSKYANIHSATYTMSLSLNMVPREPGARPFPEKESSDDIYGSYSLASYLPSDLKINGSYSMSADWKDKDFADWKFNLRGDGDFGDLAYRINIDGLQKGGKMYVKVNNFPTIPFLGDISAVKGQWIEIGESSSSPYGFPSSSFGSYEEEEEKSYEEKQEEIMSFLKRVAVLSEEHKLIEITGTESVTLNGRRLTRYNIELRKEAIAPIYDALESEYGSSEDSLLSDFFAGESTSEYLRSAEFDERLRYFEENSNLALYADTDGYPAILEYDGRIVPVDSAEQLKDRQANIVVRWIVSDINEPVTIEEPAEFKTLEEVMDELMGGSVFGELDQARSTGNDAKVRANLSSSRVAAELYYDSYGSYGPGTSSCSSGLFADQASGMRQYTLASNYPEGIVLVCNSSATSYAISANLSDGKYWCVDSTGASKAITSNLKPQTYTCL